MGTYIQKALGYGVTIPEAGMEDLLNLDTLYNRPLLTVADYKAFLEDKYAHEDKYNRDYLQSKLSFHEVTDETIDVGWKCLTSVDTNEYGEDEENPRTHIVITPLAMIREWKHSDDAIDYYELVYEYQGRDDFNMSPTMKFLDNSLFPYEGGFINHLTGKKVDYQTYRDAVDFGRLPAASKTKDILAGVKYLNGLYAELEVANGDELQEHVLPAPPAAATDLAEFLGIFKSPDTIKRLRPALLTYWS